MSNLYFCNLVSDDGVVFHSREQYYYYLYAKFLGDIDLIDKVLTTVDSLEIVGLFSAVIESKLWLNKKFKKMQYVVQRKWNKCKEFQKALSLTNTEYL